MRRDIELRNRLKCCIFIIHSVIMQLCAIKLNNASDCADSTAHDSEQKCGYRKAIRVDKKNLVQIN